MHSNWFLSLTQANARTPQHKPFTWKHYRYKTLARRYQLQTTYRSTLDWSLHLFEVDAPSHVFWSKSECNVHEAPSLSLSLCLTCLRVRLYMIVLLPLVKWTKSQHCTRFYLRCTASQIINTVVGGRCLKLFLKYKITITL